ncbi:MAG: metallophosphoesterase [Terriglobia bacterium]
MRTLQHPATPRLWKRSRLTLLSLNGRTSHLPPGAFTADPEITETVIHLRRLSPAHDGLKIVHLTDIHLSIYTPLEEVQRVVDLANSQHPDLVALTGDYVTFSPTYVWPAARALGRLKARLGTFAVLGNHDFRVNAEEVTRALRAQRIRVLRNSHYPLRAGGSALWLVGVDDLWGAFDDLERAMDSVPARDPKILLCHNPMAIGRAAKFGIDLMLSGHTHGGQVRLPLIRSLYRSKLGERFIDGWNQLGNTQIYVSRGIGTVVLPVRVACPPEITCLSLHGDSETSSHAPSMV